MLTTEPAMILPGGNVKVQEDEVVMRDTGPGLLNRRAPPHLPVIAP